MARHCTYCGTENDDALHFCVRCGTEFETSNAAPLEASLPPVIVPPLNGRTATVIFLAYLGAQFLIAFLAGFLAAATIQNQDARAEATQQIIAFVSFPMVLGGGLTMLVMSFRRIRSQLTDTTPTGAAWVLGSWKQILQGLGLGVILAMGLFLLNVIFPPDLEVITPSPFGKMAFLAGWQRLAWFSIVVVLAPVFEELLFRGVMYGGYRRSVGRGWAAFLCTIFFWLLHLPETIRFWPAMLAILVLALLTLSQRLRSEAIGPAVALHAGYNGMIALAVAIGSPG